VAFSSAVKHESMLQTPHIQSEIRGDPWWLHPDPFLYIYSYSYHSNTPRHRSVFPQPFTFWGGKRMP